MLRFHIVFAPRLLAPFLSLRDFGYSCQQEILFFCFGLVYRGRGGEAVNVSAYSPGDTNIYSVCYAGGPLLAKPI
ncbi:hypothetical protein IMCC3088_1868 [Aequoribacter fuscus]|uniref:Uncharacterized protein n=1 Tax=Aequoribacter fuscus TaxID=2518989 RepID=F3L2U4_9GAMM|nr:hypothetical protein IMCC3088_1868 [Aequoribacter fuscus]